MLPEGPLPLPAALAADLTRRYSEPHRAYHTLEHLQELATWFHALAAAWAHPQEVWAALLWHDAVYEPGRSDNEARSAELLRHSGLPIDLDRACRLVLLTATHAAPSLDQDEAWFLDMDMAILGASPERFDAYDAGVAHEYATIPPELYRAGRRHFLATLLEQPRFFHSDRFHHLLDAAARENLRRATRRLDHAAPDPGQRPARRAEF